MPRGLERVRERSRVACAASRPEQAIVNTAQREQRELAAFHLERGRRLFEREQDREAMAELRRAVYLSPYEAEAHLLIGRIHLRAGPPAGGGRRAEDLDLERGHGRRARVALAEAYLKLKNTAAARTELAAGARARSGVGRGQAAAADDRNEPAAPAAAGHATGVTPMRASVRCCRAGVALLLLSAVAGATAAPIVVHRRDRRHHPSRGSRSTCERAIEKADAAGAALVVITLRTPGGLVDSTRDINNAIIAAKTPVAVFVGPSGNRAASAGFLITIAADVAAMAPGTHIGAAHPGRRATARRSTR